MPDQFFHEHVFPDEIDEITARRKVVELSTESLTMYQRVVDLALRRGSTTNWRLSNGL